MWKTAVSNVEANMSSFFVDLDKSSDLELETLKPIFESFEITSILQSDVSSTPAS